MKRILVTGASRGIGAAIAKTLAAEGIAVVIHYRNRQDAALAVQAEIEAAGGQASLLAFDVSDRAAAKAALEADMAANGPYYGVVVNAGITRDGAFPALTDDDWDSVIHTNLDGFYNVLKPVVMPMVQGRKGGRIVTLASVSGLIGNRGQVNYSASKAGIIGATKALALELAKRKITVNCVAPGLIESDMTAELEHGEHIVDLIPLRRAGQAQEVADAVAFLCSDKAGYITRQVLAVNGGLC
ncbi:3-oxoacyl-ACP reductase FabG [Gallaecimonas xiamenensis]|uniref:3-ketoacyl-(Acyl-carrier-protein) reductase n=1 Tax=Gallaecimonas xiamenensis 3-C-1 TaxID=745411 RepID=K2JQA4_9GAMM|nr:3-oxoacyl-ACP reductase FabG [Gallaecimonas xiamenensis]EKE76667.1 3-ketoacyl-(acyl-carrier-protein) reductase [Gallaecimonas xiamenensis 3-C-1]